MARPSGRRGGSAVPADAEASTPADAADPLPRVTIISRAGCHLCDVALEVVEAVCAPLGVGWQVADLDGPGVDPEVWQRLTDKLPVIVIDGKIVAHWRVSPAELHAALARRRR